MENNNGQHWISRTKPLQQVTVVEISKEVDLINEREGKYVLATILQPIPLVKKDGQQVYDSIIFYKEEPTKPVIKIPDIKIPDLIGPTEVKSDDDIPDFVYEEIDADVTEEVVK